MGQVKNHSYQSWIPPLVLLLVFLGKGAEGFFIKHSSGSCVIVTKTVRASGGHYIHYFVELQEKCLDERAQFRFRKKGVLYNEEVYGCIVVYTKYGGPKDGTLFFYYPISNIGKIEVACQDYWNVFPFNQTSGGSLLIPKKIYSKLDKKYLVYGSRCVSPYKKSTTVSTGRLKLVLECDNEDQRFTFGSVTCDGKKTTNMNCPQNQMIVVNNAFYGGSSEMKTCDYDEDTNCTLDATCYMKGICEGNKSCENVTVDGSAFGNDPCPDKKKYLYVEYQCFNVSKPGIESEGVVCSIALLQNKSAFPDSQFTSSKAENRHEAYKARLSSDTSWCASCDEKPYLQIDLGGNFVIYNVTTLGDNGTENWVRSYQLNYTLDFSQWEEAFSDEKKIFPGNTAGNNDAVTREVEPNIAARAVRFIPVTWYGLKPCMRVEICGNVQYPGKPRNLVVNSKTSSVVKFSWTAPIDGGDGGISGYQFIITGVDIVGNKHNHNGTTSALNAVVKDLKPFTTFRLSVLSQNKHGFSNGTSVNFTTEEGAPSGAPLGVNTTTLNSTSIRVSWKDPELGKQNGIIVNYTVCLSLSSSDNCRITQATTVKTLLVNHLNSSTRYFVRVLASTKAGKGEYSEPQEQITNGKPLNPPKNETTSTLVFTLQEALNGFKYFVIVAMKLSDAGVPNKSPNSYDTDEFVNYSTANASETPLPYIAARINVSESSGNFILGSGETTSRRKRRSLAPEYYNGPLQDDQYYRVFQRFFDHKDNYYSSDWSEAGKTAVIVPPTTPTKEPTTITTEPGAETPSSSASPVDPEKAESSESGNTAVIAAVISVLIVVIIVAIVVVFIIRKRRQGAHDKSTRGEHPMADVDGVDGHEEDSNDYIGEDNGVDAFDGSEAVRDDVYSNQAEIEFQKKHVDIPISKLAAHIRKMEKDEKFKVEFEELLVGKHFRWDVSTRSFNKEKNRYANIATYDHSRVILSGGDRMDYINASYVDGITEKYYIATQGPKDTTINDFWRMIYEKRCPTIVMVTSLVEIGKRKCEQYWPEDNSYEMYGDIKLINRETKTFADYITREFTLEKGDEKHEVKQFHFQSWPDHGVPQYPTQLLSFRSHFKWHHNSRTGPAVIHCSAGVGRTGVFISIDKMIDDLEQNKTRSLNIFNVVKQLRTRRINMVQVLEQYVFIHTAILDYITCGVNEVDSTNIGIEIKNMSKPSAQGHTGFETKFKCLNKVSPSFVDGECDAALLRQNATKNRSNTIIPSESSRVFLNYAGEADSSDYINACFVDGYLGRNFFVATQTPLERTINDFWRMVCQLKSSTIVMLNQLREGDQEYPMFWPTERKKSRPYGSVTVMLDMAKKKGNAIVRTFVISPSPDMQEGRKIRMIQYMGWPDHGVPDNPDEIVTLLSEVEDSQRAGEKGPTIVVCSDGAGRTGAYIAISNLVDRMKAMQVVDVFQSIKLIRASRPQFVENEAQFQFCYVVAEAVLKSFDGYSNFQDLRG